MAQPTQPWNHYTYPSKGYMTPGVVTFAGSFTTDASGNVTSVSGIAPGMTVSGTSLSSGVYTCFFGDGPNINQVGTGGATPFAGGSPTTVDTFARVLYLSGEVCSDGGNPVLDSVQAIQRDAVAGQGKLQYLRSSATGVPTPGVAISKTIQVLAHIVVSQKVS